jgi:hypothetical protein
MALTTGAVAPVNLSGIRLTIRPRQSSRSFLLVAGTLPDNDISGGRVLWSGMRGTRNRAGQIFRMGAFALHHDLSPMGDHLRRMKSKIGPAAAQTATAHKIAVIFYTMVKNRSNNDASIRARKDAEREQRFEARLKRQAHTRGYKLVKIEENIAT